MQIVSIGDNLHEISKPVSGKNRKNISMCRLLKLLLRVLSINYTVRNGDDNDSGAAGCCAVYEHNRAF